MNLSFDRSCVLLRQPRLLEFGGRPVAQRRVQPRLVVDLVNEAFQAASSLRQIAVFLSEVEWRGALQPRALPEPDLNLSIYPAPIIGPLVPSSNVRTVPDRGV